MQIIGCDFYCFARCYSLFYPHVFLGSFLFVLYIFVPIGACILEDHSSFFHILMRSCSHSKREKRQHKYMTGKLRLGIT